jgi:hypothetical protein
MKAGMQADAVIRQLALACILFAGTGTALPSEADGTAETEIEYLLTSVGTSQCEFVRNGSPHSGSDAESHLRMKYRRGQRYVKSAEQFINRIASASSLSKRPYLMRCEGAEEVPAGDWLHTQLKNYRNQASVDKNL